MSSTTIRKATLDDIAFLVETVLAAEGSGTDKVGLATLYGLQKEQLPPLLRAMFEEEIEGCELSVDSFLIAEEQGVPVAAVAGWIEGMDAPQPSAMLRTNLIGFTFPREALETMRSNGAAGAALRLERSKGELQIEYVYVHADHRGKRLAARLIEAHMERALRCDPPPGKVQIHLFSNNQAAVSSYTAMGFRTVQVARSSEPRTADLFPHTEKLLMERSL